MNPLTEQQQQAFGLSGTMLVDYQQVRLHRQMLADFVRLCKYAAEAGFQLSVVSGHRSYQQQLHIWNNKAQGLRPLLDASGTVIDYNSLTRPQLLAAILRWSAVPGLSRHHWGTDVDVFDGHAMARDQVRLVPAEVDEGGPCAALHDWLSERIRNNQSCGFFRPYQHSACQVAEEKWHLSYLPLAGHYQQLLDTQALLALWRRSDIALLDQLEANVDEIIRDYARLDYRQLPDWVADYAEKNRLNRTGC